MLLHARGDELTALSLALVTFRFANWELAEKKLLYRKLAVCKNRFLSPLRPTRGLSHPAVSGAANDGRGDGILTISIPRLRKG